MDHRPHNLEDNLQAWADNLKDRLNQEVDISRDELANILERESGASNRATGLPSSTLFDVDVSDFPSTSTPLSSPSHWPIRRPSQVSQFASISPIAASPERDSMEVFKEMLANSGEFSEAAIFEMVEHLAPAAPGSDITVEPNNGEEPVAAMVMPVPSANETINISSDSSEDHSNEDTNSDGESSSSSSSSSDKPPENDISDPLKGFVVEISMKDGIRKRPFSEVLESQKDVPVAKKYKTKPNTVDNVKCRSMRDVSLPPEKTFLTLYLNCSDTACLETFANEEDLQAHQKSVHKIQFHCPLYQVCGKSYNDK